MIDEGVDEKTAMKVLAHEASAMFRRYKIVTRQHVAQATGKKDEKYGAVYERAKFGQN